MFLAARQQTPTLFANGRETPDIWCCDRFEIEVPVYSAGRYSRREGFLDCVLNVTGRQHGYTRHTLVVATKSGRYKVDAAYGAELDFTAPHQYGFMLADRHAYGHRDKFDITSWSLAPTLPGPHPAQFEARFKGCAVAENGGELIAVTREVDEDQAVAWVVLPIEIKTAIPSLGDLIRQLQRYRGGTINNGRADPVRSLAVVSPDDRWRAEIVEQGFAFVAPADLDPEWPE